MALVSLSITTTPMYSNFVPVDWIGSPFSPAVITVWLWPSIRKSAPVMLFHRSMER